MSSKILLFAFTLLFGLGSNAACAQPPVGLYNGYAYGTFANLTAGPLASELGATAFTDVPCLGTNGQVISNSVNSLQAKNPNNGKLVLQANEITTTGQTSTTTDSDLVTATSKIQGLNVLDGLITADLIMGEANTSAISTVTGTTISSNGNGSNFVNLRIAGTLIVANGNVAPNTKIQLPGGLGTVILDYQNKSSTGKYISVQMIQITIARSNDFGLPVGALIVIAYADSAFFPVPGPVSSVDLVDGHAYAAFAYVTISNVLTDQIGDLAFVDVEMGGSCFAGTPINQSNRNSIVDGSINQLLSVGTGDTSAAGGPTATGATTRTTATAQNVGLFPTGPFPKGILTVSAVKAVSETDIVYGVRTRSTTGSQVVGLTVAGVPITVALPNTKVVIPGVGTAILDEQIVPAATSAAPTVVNGIHITVTQTNLFKLPVGAQIIVSHADSLTCVFSKC
jgi:hypothetical protein